MDYGGSVEVMAYIIAEIGFNHEGNMKVAAEMIREAAKACANAVKFQTFRAANIALPSSEHFASIKDGEISFIQHQELAEIARDNNIDFLSTPYSPWAIDVLEQINVRAYKVASMDCTNKHLLGLIAQTRKPIYLSTGMATLTEIGDILKFLSTEKSGPVTLLHCISLYPPKAEDLNLIIISLFKKLFSIPVGYSDHYPGIQACLAAIILGAEVVETHFTLDLSKEGADHYHSLDPDMMKRLVVESKLFIATKGSDDNIHNSPMAESELFAAMKGSQDSINNRPDRLMATALKRGVYAAKNLKKGYVLKEEDILFCRPTSQLSPNDIEWLKNRTLTEDILAYDGIKRSKLD